VITLFVGTNTKLTADFCKRYLLFYSYGGAIFFTSVVNAIFVIRIHALYGKSRKILALFVFLCVCEFGFEIATTSLAGVKSARTASVRPLGVPWPGCVGTSIPAKLTMLAWIPCLIVASAFFIFTVAKFKETLRVEDANIGWSDMRQRISSLSPVMIIFVRDGSVFFFLILAILSICTGLIVPFSGQLAPPALPWIYAVYSFSGSHLVLDLRKAGKSGVDDTIQFSDGIPLASTERMAFWKRSQQTTKSSAQTLF